MSWTKSSNWRSALKRISARWCLKDLLLSIQTLCVWPKDPHCTETGSTVTSPTSFSLLKNVQAPPKMEVNATILLWFRNFWKTIYFISLIKKLRSSLHVSGRTTPRTQIHTFHSNLRLNRTSSLDWLTQLKASWMCLQPSMLSIWWWLMMLQFYKSVSRSVRSISSTTKEFSIVKLKLRLL